MGNSSYTDKIHLTVSATSVNLQRPENITNLLDDFVNRYPGVFKWAGEINVFKHALAGNGFFDGPRVTTAMVNSGKLDHFFNRMIAAGWPVTLHCDLGCDNYDVVPVNDPRNPLRGCEVPPSEMRQARVQWSWWKDILGPHYPAFFNEQTNTPNPSNFKRIQHLQVII